MAKVSKVVTVTLSCGQFALNCLIKNSHIDFTASLLLAVSCISQCQVMVCECGPASRYFRAKRKDRQNIDVTWTNCHNYNTLYLKSAFRFYMLLLHIMLLYPYF